MSYESILHALKKATAALRGADVSAANQERPASIAPSAGRLVDLTAFLLTLELTSRSTAEDAPAAAEEGRQLASKLQDEYVADVNQYIVPVLDGWGLRAFKARWTKLAVMGKDPELYTKRAMFVLAVLEKLQSKNNVMRSIFTDGRVYASAKALADIAEAKTSEEQLQALSILRPVGHMANTRSWMKTAFTILDVETPEFEEVVSDVAIAQDLGAKLKNVEIAITNSDDQVSKEKLKEERGIIVENIQGIAAQSVNPQAVLAAAATIAASVKHNHKSETGRLLMLSPDQEDAMMVRGKSIIAAAAGSGKTRVMAGKVVYHIRELGASPNQFIATSFSRKSSNELIERIRKYGGAGIIEDGPSTEGMGTTHSIAGRFLSHYGRGSRNILNGSQPSALMKMAIDQVKMRPTMPTRMPAPGGFFGEPKAVGEDEGEVLEVKAPVLDPNSPQARATKALSKLKDMKKRVKEDEPSAWEKTALSAWERDAIEDMLTKMASGRLTNPSPKQLPFLNKGFKILEATSPVSAAVVSADNKSPRGPRTGGSRFWKEPANKWFNLGVGENGFLDDNKRAIGPKQVLLQVTKWKANLVTPEQAFNENQNVFAAAYGAYEWLKANAPEYSGWRDHDDTLVNACQLLVKNPKALAQLQSRYKYVFIDEAQDLNKAQHLMFGLIAGTYDPATQEPYPDGRLSADTYTLIGDDRQAIYEFRGATPDKFINMSELVPGGQNFTTKLLDTNYRSGRVIVDAANHLISHNKKQIPMTCKAHEGRKGLGVITAKVTPNAEAAARLTAETVRDLTDGEGAQMSYKDFGVAVRTNAEAFSFCAEFLRLGIPFRSKVNFFNNPTTKSLLNWMRLANSDPTDTSTINDVVLNSYGAPSFNLNNVFDDALQRKASGQNLNYLEYLESGGWKGIYEGDQAWRNAKYVKPYVEMLRAVKDMKGSPTEVLNFIMELRGPTIAQGKPGQSILESLVDETKKDPESTDLLAQESSGKFTDEDVRRLALAPVQPLVDVCSNFADLGPCMTYLAKLQRANEKNHKQDDPEAADYAEPAVVVDTVHGWKGLEVKHIFVPMAKGVFPHARSMGDEDALASERRLAYVAITRGQDSVTILCPMENHVGKPAGPSQFVSEACISIEKGRGDNGEEPVSASFADDDFYTEVFDATPWYLID